MGKSRDLTDFEKGMNIGYRARGGGISETAAFVKCSRSAQVNVYNNWKNHEGVQSRRANCGAPRAINDRGERRLRRLVKSDRRSTVDAWTAQMNQKAIQDNCATHSIAYWPSHQTSDFSTHVNKRASQETSRICITAETLETKTEEEGCFFR
ncbi:hypothetical protein AVEN_86457-1 [Araneus ventricosus]|uniref:Tc3 transposase DNA binding domain-containing protein n=1 Tax=Araneus ventricosus TaxID=182803 RepID=A0A4Y2AC57_ARAVE|nr:hypothetical protein AVEN_86457-1 [Araneus ventricosus]